RRHLANDRRRGERHHVRARGRGAAAADPPPAGRSRPDRLSHRLRHGQLRGVQRDSRPDAREELHGSRNPGGRRVDRDRRGPGRGGAADPAPAGVQRSPRTPMRLLHSGNADERDGAPAREPEAVGRGDCEGDPGQHLPLHRLLEHLRGDQGGVGMTETTVTEPIVVEEQETRPGYAGEPVTAVVANTRETARDAAELVEVDYEPLPAVTDARRALDDDAQILHDDAGTNLTWEGLYEWGDLDAAFAEADRVVKISELHFHRFNSTPLECNGALVEYNRGTGQWTLITNNQFPGFAAIMMGPAMRVGLDKLRF